ncbi:MAG: hypothetical protein E6G08_08765 [Actinobacteria bacterium]|nr:MAG: hypothetical protein E6G08_08765 [Actinomycetota bacterium]
MNSTLEKMVTSIWSCVGRRGRPPAPAPRLAAGTELLGRYKDSGLREPPWLVRRADGRVVQLTELLYAVAGSLDGASSLKTVATRVSAAIGRTVTSENVLFLLENKLCPLGLVAGTAPMAPGPMDAGPLQLTMRGRLLPASVVGAVARLFQPLFAAGAVGGVLGLVAAADLWLFAHHGLTRAFHQLIVRPELVVVVFGLVVASVLFHELGHAAACRYGGARPGVIGIGLYLIYPAFYTDVTDVYRLGRGGRIRTDLGGIYFNLVFVVGLYAAYAATGFEPLLAVVAIEHALVANQFWPWLRLDGYYVLNDLTGVPDVLSRVGPVLRSLVPGRAVDPRAGELKPWVRWVLTAYALVLVPVLVGLLVLVARAAPQLLGAAWTALHVERAAGAAAAAAGDWGAVGLAALRALLLVLPACGLLLGLSRLALRLLGAATARAGRRVSFGPALAFAAGAAVAIAFAGSSQHPATAVRPDDRGGASAPILSTARGRGTIATPAPFGRPAPLRQVQPVSSGQAPRVARSTSASPTANRAPTRVAARTTAPSAASAPVTTTMGPDTTSTATTTDPATTTIDTTPTAPTTTVGPDTTTTPTSTDPATTTVDTTTSAPTTTVTTTATTMTTQTATSAQG